MAVITSQQITRYYDLYRDTEITFSKEVIRTLKMDPRQIYVKCTGSQWPCIINSTSLQAARIIVGTKGGAYTQLSQQGATCSLGFCFINDEGQPIRFFVNTRVQEVSQYMNSQDLAIISLAFTQRPPDDLIESIGKLLEANFNAIRRREERIIITEDSKRLLGLAKEEAVIFIQNIPRHCIIRDLSFSGCKVILMGLANFLKDKEAIIRLDFEDSKEPIPIKGTIMSADSVQGRKELISLSIKYDESLVPMAYKLHINDYVTNIRKNQLANQQAAAQKQAQAAAQQQAAAQAALKARQAQVAAQQQAAAQAQAASQAAVQKARQQNQQNIENMTASQLANMVAGKTN